jgi:hypothetical protein
MPLTPFFSWLRIAEGFTDLIQFRNLPRMLIQNPVVIGAHRDFDGRMPELTRHIRDVMPCRNAYRGRRMSPVMNSDPAKFCFFARLVMNPAMHITRIEWLTVLIDVIPRKLPWFGETFWVPKMPMIIS